VGTDAFERGCKSPIFFLAASAERLLRQFAAIPHDSRDFDRYAPGDAARARVGVTGQPSHARHTNIPQIRLDVIRQWRERLSGSGPCSVRLSARVTV
jgi:hypothetical protein